MCFYFEMQRIFSMKATRQLYHSGPVCHPIRSRTVLRPSFRLSSSRLARFQPRHSQQVASARHKVTPRLRSFYPTIAAAPQSTHRFHPAKNFLHPLADAQAGLTARSAGGALIQPRHLHPLLAGDMGRKLAFPATRHESFLVIALVGSHGFGVGAVVQLQMLIQLLQGHDRFALGDGVVNGEVSAQSVSILHQGVSAKIQSGFLAGGLLIQHALPVGRAVVSVVATFLPVKVDRRVARIVVFGVPDFLRIPAILAHETLQAGPRFDEGAVGGEVSVAGPALLAREIIDLGEEKFGDLGGKDALIVLGEDAVVEAALAELTVKEPKPEQIVGKLFAEKPLAAHTVEGGQDAGLEQLLGRNAVPTFFGVELIKQGRELLQHGIDAALDGPQRMVGGHEGVEINDGEEVRLGLRCSTHVSQTPLSNKCSNILLFFNSLLGVMAVFRVFWLDYKTAPTARRGNWN